MKLAECRFLADQNVDTAVVASLRSLGIDVVHVAERSLSAAADENILESANRESRVILSHDADFGRLAVLKGLPFLGLVFIRPGHMNSETTLSLIRTVFADQTDLPDRFIIVADRRGDTVSIRIRSLPTI